MANDFVSNYRGAKSRLAAQNAVKKSLPTRGDMQKARRATNNQTQPNFVKIIDRTPYDPKLLEAIKYAESLKEIDPASLNRYNQAAYSEPVKVVNPAEPVNISNSPKYNFKAVSQGSLNDLKNRQSMDIDKDNLDSRFYNYIPFSYEDEVGTQYGLIQTPSFAKDEVTGVFLDNGFSMGPEDAMKFISSARRAITIPSTGGWYRYPWYNGSDTPTNWLNNMRERYLENNQRSIYNQQVKDSITRYKQTGRL